MTSKATNRTTLIDMDDVFRVRTERELEKQIIDNEIIQIPIRKCSICGKMLCYYFTPYGFFFDPNCDCVGFISPMEKRDFSEFVFSYNAIMKGGTLGQKAQYAKAMKYLPEDFRISETNTRKY